MKTRKTRSLPDKENQAQRRHEKIRLPTSQGKQERPQQRGTPTTSSHSPLRENEQWREHLGEGLMSHPAELQIGDLRKQVASTIKVCPNNALFPRPPREQTPGSDEDQDISDRPRQQENLLPTWEDNGKRLLYSFWTTKKIPGKVVRPR